MILLGTLTFIIDCVKILYVVWAMEVANLKLGQVRGDIIDDAHRNYLTKLSKDHSI